MIYCPGEQYIDFWQELARMFCDLVVRAAPEEYDLEYFVDHPIPPSKYPPEVDEACAILESFDYIRAHCNGDYDRWNFFIGDRHERYGK